MGQLFGSRTLLAAAIALVVLLGALAAVQWRWSLRVAAADEQREREHLDSAASLFADEFNKLAEQAEGFLQNDAWEALQTGKPAADVPKLVSEVYYLDLSAHGSSKVRRLTPSGTFVPTSFPNWIAAPDCATAILEQPLALVVPVYPTIRKESDRAGNVRILKTFGPHPEGCFAARIDQTYLRDTLFPRLIRQSFGVTAVNEYNFAIVSRNPGHDFIYGYGTPMRSDLTRPFFSIMPGHLPDLKRPTAAKSDSEKSIFFVRHVEGTIIAKREGPLAYFFGPGIWNLQIAHKGAPLAVVFERRRWRDLLVSLSVELLLLAAIVFLAVTARQMQRLADRKVQFVAGVSHELRTPVSAIAMLSRNQADGLVTGLDRVKQYGELIHQQARRLNEMVEQTLQYAGIHSGLRRLAKHKIDLRRLIREIVDARRDELERSGFELELALDPNLPPVMGDIQLLRIALDNLLNNASRHASSGQWIRIAASYSVKDKEVQVSVEDRGAGIASSDQREIFEPFCRGRAAIEGQVPGSGLGLSLVRDAAEAHRGSVTLVSEPGHGSAFTLHLPV